ncbi:protein-glutamate O-methyltransferase CheR [Cohnella endophytica]|uniref:protein-glutamate O-methyltransferase n=1 Tax=Cohnella endophytica TaxID=2419778 RepID=A0A494XJJ4_9BACL|nr:protein-glutamate O-methyltransferase CheR [Cohnella endophytica]RKP49891.1 protein-glutamate O-methyltransferase CheR [Cohnella endophytica]
MITITNQEFKQIADFIKAHYGIYLKEEKRALVTGRLQQVLVKRNMNSFTDYFDYLVNDRSGEAITTLVDKMTTNHTFFMREAAHFHFFRDQVLPFWIHAIKDRDLRVWSAACSSGEEPYTLAMIIDEFLGKEQASWDSKVLATDISNAVLDVAKDGVYSNEKIEPLPNHWKIQYFNRHDADHSVLNNRIRNQVIYRKYNLMDKSIPFKKKFHAIFCRNVMIYFDNETKTELIDRLYDMMEYGGYLFVGQSESLNRDTTRFKYVMPAVYRKL